MDEMENKLGAILGNPEMMQKIMSLAQSFESGQEASAPVREPPAPGLPDLDPGMLQKLAGLMGQSSIDKNQQALLRALAPYLSQMRIQKLERAMRAARMASMAGTVFGGSLFFGR